MDETEQTIAPTGESATEFHISKPDGWPAGKYRVEILLNGATVQTRISRSREPEEVNMPELMDMLTQLTQGDTVKMMSRQLGTNEKSTATAISAALPLLLTALARNSSSQDGAQSLHQALQQDHDGSVLDNLSGFLGNAEAGPGAGILRHLLGKKQDASQSALAKASGIDPASAGKLLIMLAPLLMGALGRAQRQDGLDAGGLAGMLQTERQNLQQKAPDLMGFATRFLDKDSDGSIVDDLGNMLGKLLGKR